MNNLYKQLEEEWRNNWFDFIKKNKKNDRWDWHEISKNINVTWDIIKKIQIFHGRGLVYQEIQI